jgi:hypothetical protein
VVGAIRVLEEIGPGGMARLVRILSGRAVGLASVIMQSMMVGASHSRERLLKFESLEQAAAVGYRESIGPLREWAASQPMLFDKARAV